MTSNRLARATAAAIVSIGLQLGCTTMSESEPIPTSLPGSSWLAEDLGGRGVIDNLQSTLSFEGPDRVAGNSGCNRFVGGVTVEGERMRFGNLAGTRMMCPPAVMDQEQKFLDALARTDRFGFGPPGILTLYDAEGAPVARFSRMGSPAG